MNELVNELVSWLLVMKAKSNRFSCLKAILFIDKLMFVNIFPRERGKNFFSSKQNEGEEIQGKVRSVARVNWACINVCQTNCHPE